MTPLEPGLQAALKLPPGTQPGDRRVMEGRGVRANSGRGHQCVSVSSSTFAAAGPRLFTCLAVRTGTSTSTSTCQSSRRSGKRSSSASSARSRSSATTTVPTEGIATLAAAAGDVAGRLGSGRGGSRSTGGGGQRGGQRAARALREEVALRGPPSVYGGLYCIRDCVAPRTAPRATAEQLSAAKIGVRAP